MLRIFSDLTAFLSNMLFVIDPEGDPIQKWSAILDNEDKDSICEVFHTHVKYPKTAAVDRGRFGLKHIHGMNSNDSVSVTWTRSCVASSLASVPTPPSTYMPTPEQGGSLPRSSGEGRAAAGLGQSSAKQGAFHSQDYDVRESGHVWVCVPRSQPYRLSC